MKYLPIAMELEGRRVIVVGGGKVALQKIRNFLDAGAAVHVIAPFLDPEVKDLYEERRITWEKKQVSEEDIDDAALVVSATDKKEINELVSRASRDKRIAVNVVDQPAISDFISPAVVRADKAIIAVYTDGKDPMLSRDIKNYLKENWNDFLLYRNRL